MDPITKFLMLFSRIVNVYISRETFRFESGEKSKSLGTYLYVETENDKQIINAIGENPCGSNKLLKVELFKDVNDFDKYDHLVEFVKYGLIHTTKKTAMVRPTIVCYGIDSLKDIFNNYEQGIIRRAFEDAGAVQVFMK